MPAQEVSGNELTLELIIGHRVGDQTEQIQIVQGVPPFRATQLYIKKVFKYYRLYKHQMTRPVDQV